MAGKPRKPAAATKPAGAKATTTKARRAKTTTAVIKATAEQQREAGDKRNEMQRLRDQAAIARLYLRGWLQKDIAIELNLSEATVSRDLAAITTALEESAKEDLKVAKARELAKLNHMEHELWLAWEQSKQPSRTTEKAAGEGQVARAKIKEKQQTGDPRYMEQIRACVELRTRILGILAPTKIAATTPDGEESAPMYTIAPTRIDYRESIGALRPPADDEGEDDA